MVVDYEKDNIKYLLYKPYKDCPIKKPFTKKVVRYIIKDINKEYKLS